jgi:peptidoglycan/LPS O-acetylase OafA/YrhL
VPLFTFWPTAITFTYVSNPATNKRIYGLDILRAIAIAYVMHWHGQHFIDAHIPYSAYRWLILDGVDLFFVLSGFLIGGILLRMVAEGTVTFKSLGHFWIRRWFRTLPNYFLVLTFLLVTYQLFRGGLPGKWYEYFFFVQNFNSPHPVFFSEAWSLSVEEWFYFLVPLGLFLLLLFAKSNKKAVILSWILFVIAAVTIYRTYRILTLEPGDNYNLLIRREVLTRLDSIMYGVLGAYISQYHASIWKRHANFYFILGLMVIFGTRIYLEYNTVFSLYWQFTLMSIGILFLLPKLSSIKTGKGLPYRSITLISIISYSMYLLNHRIDVVIEALFKKAGADLSVNAAAGIAAYIVFWLVSIGSSYLLYSYFEKPMTRLRERFKPNGAGDTNPAIPNISSNFQS